jgi:hypothetical protein
VAQAGQTREEAFITPITQRILLAEKRISSGERKLTIPDYFVL